MYNLGAVGRSAVVAGMFTAGMALAQGQPAGPAPRPAVPPSLQGVPPSVGPPRPSTTDMTGTMTFEPDTNRNGGDYRSFSIGARGADAGVCRDACRREPRCVAFTYVRPDREGREARCWLKSAVPLATPDTCCVSGVRSSR